MQPVPEDDANYTFVDPGVGLGPQITDEMQQSSAPKRPVSNHSNLNSPNNSEEEQNSEEDPAVIFDLLRSDSKAESGNCDVINRRPIQKYDSSALNYNSATAAAGQMV